MVAEGHRASASRAAVHSDFGGLWSITLTNPSSSSRFAKTFGAMLLQLPEAIQVAGFTVTLMITPLLYASRVAALDLESARTVRRSRSSDCGGAGLHRRARTQ